MILAKDGDTKDDLKGVLEAELENAVGLLEPRGAVLDDDLKLRKTHGLSSTTKNTEII